MASRNWAVVEAEYIAGTEAADLSQKYRIPLATIESKASRGKWGAKRKAFASQLQADAPRVALDAAKEALGKAALPAALSLAEAQSIAAEIARNAKEQGGVRLAALRLAGEWGGWKDADKPQAAGGVADALALVRERRTRRAGE